MATEKSHTSDPTPRQLAWQLLKRVWADGAYANLAWEDILATSKRSAQEKASATHLAYGTLRYTGLFDALLTQVSGRSTDSVSPEVWWVLQLGCFQWFHTATPAHAVVNESVRLAQAVGQHRASGLVNAVMRKVVARPAADWLAVLTEDIADPHERLGLTYAHPVWIVEALERGLAEMDEPDSIAELESLLASHNTPVLPTLALLPGYAVRRAGDIPTRYSPFGVALEGGSPGEDDRVRQGFARVQDEGSQLAALVATDVEPLQPGMRLVDLCSGPGGKSAILYARALEAGASLTAVEIAPHRATLVAQALRPLEVSQNRPEVLTGDGRSLLTGRSRTFDRVLLDAPCTGLGALRRRPEARWRKTPDDLDTLVDLQRSLLSHAATLLAPGGVLVYVTCSPLVEETTEQIQWLTQARDDLDLLDTPALLAGIIGQDIPGASRGTAVQLWPHRHGTDAMFIQALRRAR